MSLPQMSRHEASWHEHLAGMRAAEKARAMGGDPTAIEAIATATAGPVEIGGFRLQPASEGTIWTLKRLAKEFDAWADAIGMPSSIDGSDGHRELIELGLSTLAFCDSLTCWMELEAGNLEAVIMRAERLMFNVPVETTKVLEAHFQLQMSRIRALNPDSEGTPGKSGPAGASGNSPAMPIPPEVTDSPQSNGYAPSIM